MDSYIEDHGGSGRLGLDSGYDNDNYSNARPGSFSMLNSSNQAQSVQKVPAGIRKPDIRDRMHQVRMQRGNVRASENNRARRVTSRSAVLSEWNERCKIQNITIPQLISSPNCSERYRITLTWIDEQGRPHRKDINFGEEGKQEFIDHKDTTLRDARVSELKEETLINPLHPNFWKFHLLNKYPDLNVAYFKFVQDNALTNRKLVLKKEFRRQSGTESAGSANRPSGLSSLKNTGTMKSQITNNESDLMSELENYKYGEY